MSVLNLSEILDYLAKSLGLPPLLVLCLTGLYALAFAFGLLVIYRLRSFQKDLKGINRSLHLISQNLAQLPRASDVKLEGKQKTGIQQNNLEIRRKIFDQLKKTGRPVAYKEIAKYLSSVYTEYDYESALTELDQLEKQGKIEGRVVAGKLYFKIPPNNNI